MELRRYELPVPIVMSLLLFVISTADVEAGLLHWTTYDNDSSTTSSTYDNDSSTTSSTSSSTSLSTTNLKKKIIGVQELSFQYCLQVQSYCIPS